MSLIFSPLSEDLLGHSEGPLYPRSAFLIRQLGTPPELDQQMTKLLINIFDDSGITPIEAFSSTGKKDFLERILDLIRGSGFVAAIFSEHTGPNTFANIALELGFAMMCGKPIMIVKSKKARPPSDLTRTDWIEFSPNDIAGFKEKVNQALQGIHELAVHLKHLLTITLEAERMDCAIALERARKAYLLTGSVEYIDHAKTILDRLKMPISPKMSMTYSDIWMKPSCLFGKRNILQ